MSTFSWIVIIIIVILLYMLFFREAKPELVVQPSVSNMTSPKEERDPATPEEELTSHFEEGEAPNNYDHSQFMYNYNVTPEMIRVDKANRERSRRKNQKKIESIFEPPPQQFYTAYRRAQHNFNHSNPLQTGGVDVNELTTKWNSS